MTQSHDTVLAIDPGTHTGWAIRHPDGTTSHGTWNLSPRRGDGAGVRFLRLRSQLDTVLVLVKRIDRLVYELPAGHYKSGAADDLIKGMVAHIQSWAEAMEIPYEGYAPTELKKHATGKGNSPKDAMLAKARQRWPNILDDNAADALWLLDLATKGAS